MVMRDSRFLGKCSVDQRVSSALRFVSPHFFTGMQCGSVSRDLRRKSQCCSAKHNTGSQCDSTRSGITHKRMSATPRAVESTADAAASAAPAFGSVAGPLAESAPVAIYHTDAGGSITYANPAYRRMFGITAYRA